MHDNNSAASGAGVGVTVWCFCVFINFHKGRLIFCSSGAVMNHFLIFREYSITASSHVALKDKLFANRRF